MPYGALNVDGEIRTGGTVVPSIPAKSFLGTQRVQLSASHPLNASSSARRARRRGVHMPYIVVCTSRGPGRARLCAAGVEVGVAGAEPLGDRPRALGDEVDDMVGRFDRPTPA